MGIRNPGESKNISLSSTTFMILLNYFRLVTIQLLKISTIKTQNVTKLHQPTALSRPLCTHKVSSFPGLGMHVLTTPSCPHTWAVVGCRLVEAREGPKVGMLSVAGWSRACGSRQSCQTLALGYQQRALMLPGKLQNKRVRAEDRGPVRRNIWPHRNAGRSWPLAVGLALQPEPAGWIYSPSALFEHTTLKPWSPVIQHSFWNWNPRWDIESDLSWKQYNKILQTMHIESEIRSVFTSSPYCLPTWSKWLTCSVPQLASFIK